jgi:hypothetical protein
VTHVFIDESGRITATDGVVCLRVQGMVEEEPNLFMKEALGADEVGNHIVPGDMVKDFLSAWNGPQLIVRKDGGATLLETLDGQTSRRFESKDVVLDAPKFDSVLRRPKQARDIVVSVEKLLLLARTLKSLGALSVRLSLSDKPEDAIRLRARILADERIEGALMPMRDEV